VITIETQAQINALYMMMVAYESGHPDRIQHLVKVHSFAKLIGQLEGVSAAQLLIIEAAALVHDIGIKIALEQYGSTNGELQEQLGPAEAHKMLKNIAFDQPLIERVCYLVGHHHTYEKIDGLDYQILVEADFLVNLFEGSYDAKAIERIQETIFRTSTGTQILKQMFDMQG